ncbi:HAD-superfamily hydrolase, superfamily IIB, YedP [Rhodopirellula maiorica SM1]|uniref:HAD-superfamily hydrolase, superfamily IIB, YedP n=1 Tax=Rhodopirellula maiorica SM1 TaxID=1265738 RepID=M5RYM3_9BACT|nr:HAD-IIB family hydrolase [Rhodopirellula maiorica]EMI19034.1 HAD-superfamily hydrolase, superfamily IIB, YedP [Rhodopirellula maiorica SM1]
MLPNPTRLILFTDLDGCLLNKHDYDWSAAAATLQILRSREIPVIMNSSKTVPEMTQLASELGLAGNPFISENGSVICWGSELDCGVAGGDALACSSGEIEVIGASRDEILTVLKELKDQYRFRSFADLGVDGVIQETQLSHDKAQLAIARQGTEPLLWDDTDEHRTEFEKALGKHQLTLTKGGRFWHVAGQTSKGVAMQRVAERLSHPDSATLTAAIGDSPIDQSMLDQADVAIGIPTPSGLGVNVGPRGIVPQQQGAAGWAEAVTQLLSRIDAAASAQQNSPPLV